MLWFSPKHHSFLPLLMGVGGVLCLTGCGFTPQFAYHPNEKSLLSEIDIPSIPNQQGQLLRNHLLNRLPPQSHSPRYRLNIKLELSQRGVGVERDSTSSREQIQTSAVYELVEQKTRRVVGKGSCQASAYFNLSKNQVFQTISSEKSASTQALFQLRDCLFSRASLLLRQDNPYDHF